jgi:hypothetical protein
MWHKLEELVCSKYPKSAVIFNPWILRGLTRILTPTLIFTYIYQVQQAVKSLSLRIRLSSVSNLSFLCDMHWRSRFIPIIQNPLSSSILEFSEDRQGYWLPLWFSHTPSTAGSRIYKSEGQIIQCVKSVILCDIHGRNGFIPIISFPLSSSIQFDEDQHGYWLPLWFSHEPSAAGSRIYKSQDQTI